MTSPEQHNDPHLTDDERALVRRSRRVMNFATLVAFLISLTLFFHWAPEQWFMPVAQQDFATASDSVPSDTLVIDGIHVATSLIVDDRFQLVKNNCTNCHSGKLITQNRATREGWEQMIRWMQETQGLWDLGESESIILDYLAEHYAPKKQGRRAPLKNIEWYELE